MGADAIELDVRMCKTGEIVVIHDAEVDRTSNGSGSVRELSLDELKRLDFGEGEKIPTLEEVLDFAKNRILVNIEIKEQGLAHRVLDIVEKMDMVNEVLISSFLHDELVAVKNINPKILTAPLIMHRPVSVKKLVEETKAEGVHPWYEYIDKRMIEEAKSNNIFINAWTVDFEDDMKKLLNMGINGIITNDVETLRDLVEKLN